MPDKAWKASERRMAKHMGVNRIPVTRWRIPPPDGIEAMRDSMTTREIAEACGVSRKVVWRWFRDAGLSARPRGKSPESRVVVVGSGCWEWSGCLDSKGYGLAWVGGKHVKAHRYFYQKHNGPIPRGKHLDHLCRNKRCCNPGHLEPVTNAVNCQRGAKSKLTADVVRNIRKHARKGWNYDTLAFLAGVHPETIGGVVRRRSWANV